MGVVPIQLILSYSDSTLPPAPCPPLSFSFPRYAKTQAYSLYVRAAASGQSPVIPLRQHHPAAPPAGSESSRDNNQIVRAEAETSLIVTAARAHIAMGGVLDGLALLDDAAGLSGSNARARGKWGGDGEAGAGAAILGDNDASVIVEELCVSGGELGLRAALRLKERLAEEVRWWAGWDRARAGSQRWALG